jgi:hypothetical protein
MSKFVVVAAALVIVATPVLAAEYYVAQDPTTKKCNIVKEKPDGKTLTMIGTTSYPTKDEAKTARKAAAECPNAKSTTSR